MPIKRRLSKDRAFKITPEAARRWREIRPASIDGVCIVDDELADALGLPALIAMRDEDLEPLTAALDDTTGHAA